MPSDKATPKEAPTLDRTLVPAKLPKWIKQLAAQIGEMSGEDIGEVLERHSGDGLKREYRERSEKLNAELGGEG